MYTADQRGNLRFNEAGGILPPEWSTATKRPSRS